jgi:hypothetical protein
MPIGERHEIQTGGELRDAEGEARVPVLMSVPASPSRRPSTTMASALASEPDGERAPR